jgi:hypothetical protein
MKVKNLVRALAFTTYVTFVTYVTDDSRTLDAPATAQ